MLDTGRLDRIATFPALVDYLREELDWPIEDFTFDDLTYDWDPAEFGLSSETAGQIEIKQLRPIEREPWGVFFLSLPQKKLPVTVLRRILGGLAIKKRASANAAERAAWCKDDLLFIAAHGECDGRALAFAHFHEDQENGDLPTLHVLGWEEGDTIRRLSYTHHILKEKLHWRERGEDDTHWRSRWNEAFREKPGEVIATSKALAKELARLAREIRRRANELLLLESNKGPLRTLHKAFKEALIHNLKFDDFADMYAQTIAYGLLAASISRESGALIADDAAHLAPPTNPFLKELLQTFLSAGGRKGRMDFDELGVNGVIEMLRRADMQAVLLDFDTRNPSEDPVIHFYELFLKEYDANKRMQRGVFYTPRPVVSFIVRSVDEVLQREFGLKDGLASTATWADVIAAKSGVQLPEGVKDNDPFVCILDPATGTGTFLVEVVDLIHGRMTENWREAGNSSKEIDALWNDYVPKHLLPRLCGFELMMAPYAIAHMKLGLKLAETGYHFRSDERARIYLTNALEPAQDFDMQLVFMSEALAHEAQAANRAKEVRFTTVIGNPPYKGESANPSKDSRGHLTAAGKLIQHYFFVEGEPLAEGNVKWVNNDYVKFYALAEKILSQTGCGALGYITSNSWLDGPIFVGLRASLLRSFPWLAIVDCHGNVSRKERAPDGSADKGVFQISEGTGVTIGVHGGVSCGVRHFDLLGELEAKYHWLQDQSLGSADLQDFTVVLPKRLLVVTDQTHAHEYNEFAPLKIVMPEKSVGIATARDALTIHFTKQELERTVTEFLRLSPEDARVRFDLGKDVRDWKVFLAQQDLRSADLESIETPVFYRPFDVRWTAYTGKTKGFICMPRGDFMESMLHRHSIGLVSSRLTKGERFAHAAVCTTISEVICLSPVTSNNGFMFPLWLASNGTDQSTRANFDPAFLRRLESLLNFEFTPTRERGDLEHSFGPRDVFDWIYAILHSPTYRSRYADFLKSDFARIPLPGSRALFQDVVPLGTMLVSLHLLDANVVPELKDPQTVRLAGHGEPRVEHKPEWCSAGGNRVSISSNRWFEGVPERVWQFHVGGYQPAQKWLKDRAAKGGKRGTAGRILTDQDQLHYRRMIVAMDKTIDLMAEIDRAIENHGEWPSTFRGFSERNGAE